MPWILVAVGGAIGALARYASLRLVQSFLPEALFWNTLIVNVLGSFLAGLVVTQFLSKPQSFSLFLVVGVLGGFTTFSSFSIETIHLIRGGQIGLASLNMALNLSLCLAAAFLGVILGGSNLYDS